MNDRRSGLLLIATLTAAVLALGGCTKKETPADPKKAAAATDTAAKEKPAEAKEAAGQEPSKPVFNARAIIAEVDKNGDGKISRAEYDAIWRDKATAEQNFKAFDKNGDGVLTAEEFTPKLGTK